MLTIAELVKEGIKKESNKEFIDFQVVNLGYSFGSLEDFINEETMRIHYNGHYRGYVKKLNELLVERKVTIDYGKGTEGLMSRINGLGKQIKNQAGGAYNHELFWQMMTPEKQKREFKGKIKEAIESQYGSLEKFKEEFLKESKSRFGSGWCWLMMKSNGKLKIMTTPNQDNPKMNIFLTKDRHGDGTFSHQPISGKILLGLDLWEHAYYLKYKNKKEDYVNNFWKVVNWDYVNSLIS